MHAHTLIVDWLILGTTMACQLFFAKISKDIHSTIKLLRIFLANDVFTVTPIKQRGAAVICSKQEPN
jgi:hypothetical protein